MNKIRLREVPEEVSRKHRHRGKSTKIGQIDTRRGSDGNCGTAEDLSQRRGESGGCRSQIG